MKILITLLLLATSHAANAAEKKVRITGAAAEEIMDMMNYKDTESISCERVYLVDGTEFVTCELAVDSFKVSDQ